jgi:hypothetical protein
LSILDFFNCTVNIKKIDSPEISTSYFIVKDGVAIELEEQEDELYNLENGEKV